MKKTVLCILVLIITVLCVSAATAEDFSIPFTLDGEAFCVPATEAGIPYILKESVTVQGNYCFEDDGMAKVTWIQENTFDGTPVFTEISMKAQEGHEIVVGNGIRLGVTTKDEVAALLGEGAEAGSSKITLSTAGNHVVVRIDFDSNGIASECRLTSRFTAHFGNGPFNTSEPATADMINGLGQDQFILNGYVYDLHQEDHFLRVAKLLESGWYGDLYELAGGMKAREGDRVWKSSFWYYNGNAFEEVGIFNDSTEVVAASECCIDHFTVSAESGTEMILKGGVTFGSTMDDIMAAFGEIYDGRTTKMNDGTQELTIYMSNLAMVDQFRLTLDTEGKVCKIRADF